MLYILYLNISKGEVTMPKTENNQKINKVAVTDDNITGRGGMALFSRYIDSIGILSLLLDKFSFLRKSSKGLSISSLFKQIFCWFIDKTSRHLCYFDSLKKDEGYASAIETDTTKMASSHQIKRFFSKFGLGSSFIFRFILNKLFIWRLDIEKPEEIRLYIDSMVLNNDDAEKRQGVEPTYKKVKGFKPLQISWNGFIIDCIFRGGKKNCNYGDVAANMIIKLVNLIRKKYNKDVPIFLHCDSGFFDVKNFETFNALNIAFIASGKMYDGVKEYVQSTSDKQWENYNKDKQVWEYIDFGFSCKSWNKFFRAIYTRMVSNSNGQMLIDFDRSENVILTNIGINEKVLENCSPDRKEYWLKSISIIVSYHQCGTDELTHRALKDFGFEQLPFKRFNANMALYYCMLISFILFVSFKHDISNEVIPITSYATSVRRKLIDIAAKITRTGHEVILKVTNYVMTNLRFDQLWFKCQNPPPIIA